MVNLRRYINQQESNLIFELQYSQTLPNSGTNAFCNGFACYLFSISFCIDRENERIASLANEGTSTC